MLPLLLIAIIFPVSRATIRGCESDYIFDARYKALLGKRSLESVFKSATFLGKGSFGTVKEIAWEGGQKIAVKQIKKPYNRQEIKLIETEMDNMSLLKKTHAGVEFMGCEETTSNLYLLQEKLHKDLESASVLLTLKKMTVPQRLAVYKKIVDKFDVMHGKRLTHQDIKPANIMTTDKDLSDFRIIDFGMSVAIGGQVLGGTPLFNGPEKIGGIMPAADVKHDIYALAVTFAVLESSIDYIFNSLGNSCFMRSFSLTCFNTMFARIKSGLTKSGMMSLYPILEKAAAYNKHSRYSSMASFSRDLETLISKLSPKEKEAVYEGDDLADLMKSKNKADLLHGADAFEAEKEWLKGKDFAKEKGKFMQKAIVELPEEEPQVMAKDGQIKKMARSAHMPKAIDYNYRAKPAILDDVQVYKREIGVDRKPEPVKAPELNYVNNYPSNKAGKPVAKENFHYGNNGAKLNPNDRIDLNLRYKKVSNIKKQDAKKEINKVPTRNYLDKGYAQKYDDRLKYGKGFKYI